MPETNQIPTVRRPPTKQQGLAAIEFSFVAIIFFLLFFGIVELARAMYIINTLQEVTRRGAALAVNADFSVPAALQQVRERAIFRTTAGTLIYGEPISDRHIKIDYLRIPSTSSIPVSMGAALPASPQTNRVNCASNPNAVNCIQLVRVRICLPGGSADECDPVPYQNLVSLIPFTFMLPPATTIAKMESLGMPPGMPCSC
jgi:hypothetical protein